MMEPTAGGPDARAFGPGAIPPVRRARPVWERWTLAGLCSLTLPIAILWLIADADSGVALVLIAMVSFPFALFVIAPLWLLGFASSIVSNWRMGPAVLAGWLGVPLSAVLCFALVLNMVPMRVRFELSRSAFDQAVATHRQEPGSIGLFSIVDIWVEDDGAVYFTDADAGFFDPCGFAHTVREGPVVYGIRDLGGGWWWWCGD